MAQATKKGYHKGCFGSATLVDRQRSRSRRNEWWRFQQLQAKRKRQMKWARMQAELRKSIERRRRGWFGTLVTRIRAWLKRAQKT